MSHGDIYLADLNPSRGSDNPTAWQTLIVICSTVK